MTQKQNKDGGRNRLSLALHCPFQGLLMEVVAGRATKKGAA